MDLIGIGEGLVTIGWGVLSIVCLNLFGRQPANKQFLRCSCCCQDHGEYICCECACQEIGHEDTYVTPRDDRNFPLPIPESIYKKTSDTPDVKPLGLNRRLSKPKATQTRAKTTLRPEGRELKPTTRKHKDLNDRGIKSPKPENKYSAKSLGLDFEQDHKDSDVGETGQNPSEPRLPSTKNVDSSDFLATGKESFASSISLEHNIRQVTSNTSNLSDHTQRTVSSEQTITTIIEIKPNSKTTSSKSLISSEFQNDTDSGEFPTSSARIVGFRPHSSRRKSTLRASNDQLSAPPDLEADDNVLRICRNSSAGGGRKSVSIKGKKTTVTITECPARKKPEASVKSKVSSIGMNSQVPSSLASASTRRSESNMRPSQRKMVSIVESQELSDSKRSSRRSSLSSMTDSDRMPNVSSNENRFDPKAARSARSVQFAERDIQTNSQGDSLNQSSDLSRPIVAECHCPKRNAEAWEIIQKVRARSAASRSKVASQKTQKVNEMKGKDGKEETTIYRYSTEYREYKHLHRQKKHSGDQSSSFSS